MRLLTAGSLVRVQLGEPKKSTFVKRQKCFFLSIAKAMAYYHDGVVDIINRRLYFFHNDDIPQQAVGDIQGYALIDCRKRETLTK